VSVESNVLAVKSLPKKMDARTRILETALAEFSSKGFDGVSTTDIAKIAGVTQPLIHYHFKSKLALWQATVEKIFLMLKSDFAKVIADARAQSKAERLVALIKGFIRFAGEHPQFGQFMMREGTQKSERLDWMIDTWARPTLSLIVADYHQGVAEGWLKSVPFPQAVSIIMAASMQFFSLAPMIESMYGVNSHDPEQVELHTKAVLDLIAKILLVEQPLAA
jgi:hypothetical protein